MSGESQLVPIAGGSSSSSSSSSSAPAAPPPPGVSATGVPVRASRDAPMRKLTTGLLRTYKAINEKYYTAKKERQAKQSSGGGAGGADSRRDADYQVTVGDVLGSHYRVVESMGKGSFGQVVSAEDMRTGGAGTERRKVAVKVIKNRDAFRRQAKTEIKLLEMLNSRDPDDQWCIGAWRTARTAGGAKAPARKSARARMGAPPEKKIARSR
jgi:serine/threonine protein kinase